MTALIPSPAADRPATELDRGRAEGKRVDSKTEIDARFGPLSFDEVVDLVIKRVFRGGLRPEEAAIEVLNGNDVDPAALRRFAIVGVAHAAASGLSSLRILPSDEEDPPDPRTFQHRGLTPAERKDALLRVRLVVADGTTKPAGRWTLADGEYVERYFRGRADSDLRRADAVQLALGYLRLSKVETIADLPAKSLAGVRKALDEAWS